ncbi:MAG: methyltransferase domain-containing protein [Gammaproteobacteria bacterium]|nr:methyltransferase domain-containing protein [Gammaproteobacteria bacterium]MCF6363615.1 methyltransferase domain-containing protein [Gammaproteobacteria bacterium]
MSGLDTQARKQKVISVFDEVAGGYDSPALRFFPFSAERALGHLNPKPGSKILDAATGTGALAMALAQAVGPQGRVIGIDLSTAMLERAAHNAAKA